MKGNLKAILLYKCFSNNLQILCYPISLPISMDNSAQMQKAISQNKSKPNFHFSPIHNRHNPFWYSSKHVVIRRIKMGRVWCKLGCINLKWLTIIENFASRLLVFSFWIILEFDEGKTVIERSIERIVSWNIETFIRFFQIL